METADFKVDVEQAAGSPNVAVFRLAGKLDTAGAEILKNAAEQAHAGGTRYLLLDFNDVSFVSSAGLGAVLAVYKMLTPRNPTLQMMKPPPADPARSPYLKLARLNPQIYYTFNISGYSNRIAIYPDVETALASFA